ncbi:TonB-dependent receptor plug domain-containing protein [Prevotella sp. S7 MS 2]|uniref:TonB-dependent receptor plug domain-containing protein n=1 Tax=Prevotella sp. S7 MS 2 TaxID=1287488 RepID=UPI00069052ED|nr:TonB-dependent receptor plug domain-containing protein [Prevotella sp. S7 MS 2]
MKGLASLIVALIVPIYLWAQDDIADSINLKGVHVTAKSKQRQLKESGFYMNMIDVRNQSNVATNLADLINQTTGARVRREGGLGADYELSLNGMSGKSVRYFLDGVPLDLKGRNASLDNIPISLIDYIEIYKGVVPSYLGGDALGGAINLVTTRKIKNYLDVSVTAGSFHTALADLNGQWVLPKSGIVIRPSFGLAYSKNDYRMKGVELWNEQADAYIETDAKRFHDGYFFLLGQMEVGVQNKSWADAFFVSASCQKKDKELQTGQIQSIVYGQAECNQHAWNVSMSYDKHNFFVDGLRLKALISQTWDKAVTVDSTYRKYAWDGSYINTVRNEITGRSKQLRHYSRPLTTIRTNFDYTLGHNQSFNLNYLMYSTGNRRWDEIDTDFEPSSDRITKHLIGLSYYVSLKGRWQASVFLKDYINHVKVGQTDLPWITNSMNAIRNTTKNYMGYGLSSRYTLLPEISVKGSFEHAARLPLANELLGNGTTVYANLALKPENSDNVNLGLYGHAVFSKTYRLDYEVAGFVRKVRDYIHAVLSEQDGLLQYKNVNDVTVKGVEGEVSYSYADWLQLKLNGTYQNARDMNRWMNDGKESVTYKNRLPNRPWLYGNAEIMLQKTNLFCKDTNIRFSYLYQYVHWFYLTWEGYGSLFSKAHIPTQNLHSATLSYSWDKMRYNISLECNNIFDTKAYDNYKLQKPSREWMCKFRVFIN